MELSFDLSSVFPDEPIQKLDRTALIRLHPRKCWAVQKAIDALGELSTTAQGLKRVLTTYDKVVDSDEDQRIYFMWNKDPTKENSSIIVGLLRVGYKKLYLLNSLQQQFEEKPLCILDFYIHDSMQRKGNGHKLFDFMLTSESVAAWSVAIDRPSEAFTQFLEKFYGLKKPVWQSTNYVVYSEFFEDKKTTTKEDDWMKKRRGARSEKTDSYDNTPSMSPRPTGRMDSASAIIHGAGNMPARRSAGPDTPLGRKNTRDFGHQNIW